MVKDTAEGPPLPERSSPQEGDVVVTREEHSRVRFAVRQLPGVVQFSAHVRDEAVRLARSFGQEHRINVWYSEDGRCRLLAAYRPAPSSARLAGAESPRPRRDSPSRS